MKTYKSKADAIKLLEYLLFRKKYEIYRQMGRPHDKIRDIGHECRISDSDLYHFVNLCQTAGFIDTKKEKRYRRVKFTPKGQKLYDAICTIDSIFSEP